MNPSKKAVIIGAGPAGLTAALELLRQSDIKPVIYEESTEIGGISRTATYKGNRMDIGGHRFFSKSNRIMNWWTDILPIQGEPASDYKELGRTVSLSEDKKAPNPEIIDETMLVRNRLSRIFYLRSFFDYPVSLNWNTIQNLGFGRILKTGFSYIFSRLFPIKNEMSLEDFFINRFGRQLYLTFFKDYTEKVWGLPCSEISSEWGAQRIKGLSLTKTLAHAIKSIFPKKDKSISQKDVETSLIEHFLYPKFGPGQLWEEVAKKITGLGGEIHFNRKGTKIKSLGNNISSIEVTCTKTGKIEEVSGDYFFSTMPVKDLIKAWDPAAPDETSKTAAGLMYRDFITVGLLLEKLVIQNETDIPTMNNIVPDNWIYIQERDVKVGRLQIFNNWSPYMVNDPSKSWIGLEYFCNERDELWNLKDQEMIDFAKMELEKIGITDSSLVKDAVVIRVKKTYPAYFGTYENFDSIRNFTDEYANLFLVGRNGMHRYNNMDHSMLTAITAVENIINDKTSKENIWAVNTEESYHENK